MDYNLLLDLVADLGYELAMCGAETFRIEESVRRITASYHVQSEVFAIPNFLIISVITDSGKPLTRIRRIGYHGNNLDAVEQLNALSRKICAECPAPQDAIAWLEAVRNSKRSFPLPIIILGSFLGAAGFSVLFGCTGMDILLSGICGILTGFVCRAMDKLRANQFFNSLIASFFLATLAWVFVGTGLGKNGDTMIIGALMLLVPGLLFTNGMRDIIYGDTNSGVNRIVQVLLISVALALGTAAAWNVISKVLPLREGLPIYHHTLLVTCIASAIGCIGFSILSNIHGPGSLLCAFGGTITWLIYSLTVKYSGSEIAGYFWGAAFASLYAEIMARIRKYPAISYLVISIYPLIPGAGVYYTMTNALHNDMSAFAAQGMFTAAIAGAMAAGILLVSSCVRLYYTWKNMRFRRKS